MNDSNYKGPTDTSNPVESKAQQCKLEYQFNIDNSTKKFTLTVDNIGNYFVILPKNLLVTNQTILGNSTRTIFDPYFNIIRVNEKECLVVEGYTRGQYRFYNQNQICRMRN